MKKDLFMIPVEKLKKICNYDEELSFCKTSQDVTPSDEVIGQERALRSMQFGLAIDSPDFNIFVVGMQGTGKSTFAQAIISKSALSKPVPDDWCYINNFNDQDQPLVISLPAGQGRVFQNDMKELLADLKTSIPKAFEGNIYEQKKDTIVQSLQSKIEVLFKSLENEADQEGFAVKSVPPRFVLVPVKDGKMMPNEDYEQLPQEERKELEVKGRKLEKKLEDTLHEVNILQKQVRGEMLELEKQVVFAASESQVNQLKIKYEEYPKIVEYLQAVLQDVQDNHTIFNPVEPTTEQAASPFPKENIDYFSRYAVNLFINNEKSEGAPVIFEANPYYYNIFGKIEYKSQVLAVNTDLTMVKPGSIHKANGGYLILQINDLMKDPSAWDALKKALKYKQATVENIGEQYRLVPTVGMKPEPVPLNIKVILIGTPGIFELLTTYDEDFNKLFKIKVDFDVEMPRTPENIYKYVSFVSQICRKENFKHFDRTALGRIIEYSSRMAGDQNKLSTQFSVMNDLICEAATVARLNSSEYVQAHHVDEAIKERKYRSNKAEEKLQEQIKLGNILIKTDGAEIGQINGLSVIEFGGYSFGLPSRITARTYAGHEGVINIERETKMSGNIHAKGVLILSGYLGGKFGQKKSLGLTAQITFEQNYSGVDGDSASSTELYAILSSIAGVPLKQSIAVTGSVDQRGDIQPIGGATQKIEGFFDLCNSIGLTGEQGVMIPIQNVDNLMLKDEIIAAVKENKFHIYAVSTIEEGIELLSGVPAGTINESETYPKNTIFGMVALKLEEYGKGLTAQTAAARKPNE